MEDSSVTEEPIREEHSWRERVFALFEVIVVRFVIYALLARILLLLLFGSIDSTDPLAGIVIGSLWFVIPISVILIAKRNLTSYGFTTKNIRVNVDTGLKAFLVLIPTIFGYGLLMILGWSYLAPNGALLMTGMFIVSLTLILLMLNKSEKHKDIDNKNFYGNIILILVMLTTPIIGGFLMDRLSFLLVFTVVWQFIFSGFGEEAFFRGYIQSRLNEAFGRPYKIGNIQFGLGLIITALLFSVTHILNTFDLYTLTGELAIWWGTFTFVGGLIFGLLREWSGSIVPGGIAHGLDAFGEALGVLMS